MSTTGRAEEDMLVLLADYAATTRSPQIFRDRADPLAELDDENFRKRYRLTKHLFVDLLGHINPQLQHATTTHGGLLPMHQLLVAIRFYASGSFLVSSICSC